jgi:hypothetical protein
MRNARPAVPSAGLLRLRRRGGTARPDLRVLALLLRRPGPADRWQASMSYRAQIEDSDSPISGGKSTKMVDCRPAVPCRLRSSKVSNRMPVAGSLTAQSGSGTWRTSCRPGPVPRQSERQAGKLNSPAARSDSGWGASVPFFTAGARTGSGPAVGWSRSTYGRFLS